MFNGIIFKTGVVKVIKKSKNSIYVGILTKINFKKKEIGSSIACDGVCLTLVKIQKNLIFFYISNETLIKSNFKNLKLNQIVNLEKSLIFGQNISGHFTQGHVDSVAKIKKILFIDKTWLIKFEILNKKLNKFLTEKASISVNGVSLTISKVYQNYFEINVIPHTLKLTNLKSLKVNSIVNVELDIMSKYIYKYSN
jgi:riboflavin synthase|tara:strand:- start:126 stop:713 length:588 start_codon:yes stop_codon:yes gene_type:complete